MLIVGTYADGLMQDDTPAPAIPRLTKFINSILPAEVAIHLLPFYPSSGDGGFAIDDWFTVRPNLGTWSDVHSLATNRLLIVDGIYNHVGIGHKWVKQFMSSPQAALDLVHAYCNVDERVGPISPRGHCVLRRHNIAGEVWHVWQTFSETAVDIRLDNASILADIDRHLLTLKKNGVWGIRLDAVAYYAKSLGSQIRHNPGGFQIADSLAKQVEHHGMRVFAQIDCDTDGCRYFDRESQSYYVINDFTYSAYLAFAIISKDPEPLARHLVKTSTVPKVCLRAPRNHDGILLRSGLLEPSVLSRLVAALAKYGVGVRTIAGDPYEINCSAPFLYMLSGGRDLLYDWIELAVAVTGMTPGWSYFYLPFLLGYIPEDDTLTDAIDDPRALNRKHIPKSLKQDFLKSTRRTRLYELLTVLASLHGDPNKLPRFEKFNVSVYGDHLLSLITPDGQYRLLANFSNQQSAAFPLSLKGELIYANRCDEKTVAPVGYGIWRT